MDSVSFNIRVKHRCVNSAILSALQPSWKRKNQKRAHLCLSPFGMLKQNTTNWVACKQQKFIFLNFESWKSNIRAPAWLHSGEALFLVQSQCFLCPHMAERARDFSGESFVRVLIPLVNAPSLWFKHFTKAQVPNIIVFRGLRLQNMNFSGHQHSDLSTSSLPLMILPGNWTWHFYFHPIDQNLKKNPCGKQNRFKKKKRIYNFVLSFIYGKTKDLE